VTDTDFRWNFPLGGINGVFDLKANGRKLTLSSAFAYRDGDVVVTVPSGFTTDFNSVPRPLWFWFPPWECPEAALVHDWLYRRPNGRSRETVDAIHRRIMELKGERKSKRVAAWLGIRAGGWKPWNEYRRHDADL
jgi:hypothetical protein